MSTPHSVAPETARAEREQFAGDVEYYLSLTPRQLPSKYLYDALGSALFDAICHLPWYRITRTELALLAAHGREIFARAGRPTTLVELGPGNGEKLATLIESASGLPPLAVHLVDVSADALALASRAIEAQADVTVHPHRASYEVGLAEAAREARPAGRTLALFLGSNIGNFDQPGAAAFVRTLRAALSRDDALLLGADLVKPARDLLLAYDDPLGVTAAFNRNLLLRVNRELGADFDIAGFEHRAVWNEEASRVEMHLVSRRRQHVTIPAARLDLTFEPDDTIWTESSYKYRPGEIVRLLQNAGFRAARQWTDEGGTFALTLVLAE
jgi:dimethylhistidine N-methyltransferase